MTGKIVQVNIGVSESGANTHTAEKTEIPGSGGAKSVTIVGGCMNLGTPDLEDAVNKTYGRLYAGNHEARTSLGNMGDPGCFVDYEETLNSDSTDILSQTGASPYNIGPRRVPVPPDANGRFYITGEIQGNGNANAKELTASIDVVVES